VLPGDYALFVEEFKRSQANGICNIWIMKPIGKAQGKGIFLITKLKDISRWKSEHRWKADNTEVEAYIVQRYLLNPYIVGGKKFDIRLYALVTSFSPLVVYIYRGGFCRFTNTRYSNNMADIGNAFMHLTNVAIQKGSDTYNSATGGKWDVRSLKQFIMSRHGVEAADKVCM
jgi:tubulin polyglutamylase TTLL9